MSSRSCAAFREYAIARSATVFRVLACKESVKVELFRDPARQTLVHLCLKLRNRVLPLLIEADQVADIVGGIGELRALERVSTQSFIWSGRETFIVAMWER